MGNTTSDQKTPTASEYYQSTIMNNITIITTMAIIYLFISADKYASYVYMDPFIFLNLITNPHPCDKKHSEKKKAAGEAKNANATPVNATTNPLASLIKGQGGVAGLAGLAGKLSGAAGANGKTTPPAAGNAGAAPPAGNAGAPPAAKNVTVGGGSVSEGLLKVSTTLNNVGKAINSYTADVKYDIDYESYKVDTLSKYKETYCNDMDDMGAFGAFFFIMHSSFLACYNSIQMVNVAIVSLIYSNSVRGPVDMGILALYTLFFMVASASTSFIEYVTVLIDPSVSSSDSYIRQISLSIFSAMISLFFLYFIVAVIAYIHYLIYGMLNIKSEQSSTTFKVIYAVFLFINVMITFPSVFGVNLF